MYNVEQVRLSNTEQHLYHSSIIKDSFVINIALPKNYDKSKKYPVVYLTDANIFFGLVAETSWLLQYGNEIPEIVVAAVGYPDDSRHFKLRERDLLPTKGDLDEPAGRAENFLDFICNELKPFIHDHYSVDENDSTLAGDSYGGLFGLYVLFNRPRIFRRYIIGSPSIYRDDSDIFNHEMSYAEDHEDLAARVFLSAGQLEATEEPVHAAMLSNTVKMVETLKGRNYPQLKLTSCFFDNETHLSVIPATMSRGLREVYG